MYFPEDMTFQYFFFDTYPGYFLQALPIALIAGVVFFLVKTRQTGGRSLGRTLLSTLFVCYITGLLCLTLFFDVMGCMYYFLFYHQPSGRHIQWFAWVFNFAPTFGFDAEQIGNFLMFCPLESSIPCFAAAAPGCGPLLRGSSPAWESNCSSPCSAAALTSTTSF